MVASPSKAAPVEAAASIQVRCINGSTFKSAIAETQGQRPSHEDAYAVKPRGRSTFFWVFDGHRGDAAARFAANEFSHQNFGLKSEELPSDKRIIRTFQAVDKKLQDHLSAHHRGKAAGSTAVGALTMRCQDGSYSAKLVNCGDSRGLVIQAPSGRREKATNIKVKLPESLEHIVKNAKESWSEEASWLPDWPAVLETIDHKPNRWDERIRIEAAGGQLLGGRCARIDGNLAVSRGLGDFDFKDDCGRSAAQQKVSNVPDIYQVHGMPAGTLLLLACDGLWDVMGSEEAASFVQERLQRIPTMSVPDISQELTSYSLEAGSSDNVTVLLVQLVDATDDDCSDASTSEGENRDTSDEGRPGGPGSQEDQEPDQELG